jgi:NAD(P)H-hydrate repair Nnr-like enzyme with NAD(P)H-hydrate dehydratase domain
MTIPAPRCPLPARPADRHKGTFGTVLVAAGHATMVGAPHAVVVLKGRHTVVADRGDTWTCAEGNPALAIPGSGDVLTGVIAGLIAQGLSAWDAARLGTWLHARAGDRFATARPFGLLALELAALIPEAAAEISRA